MSILKSFVKYHSLGNDFIVFDWYKRPSFYMHNELHEASWKQFVINTCDRHYGVGADGIVIITNSQQAGMPEMLIFNADGSQAETCLNGLRCIAQYLFTEHHFPQNFKIKLGQRVIDCSVSPSSTHRDEYDVTTCVGTITYEGQKTISVDNKKFNGHIVNVGNPHFIIFDQVSLEWLANHGKLIESHSEFAQRTNVEFVWKKQSDNSNQAYQVIVFERGCGITLACSSGAAAITGLLLEQGTIELNQKIILSMPGGQLTAWADQDRQIVLQASAHATFKGVFEDHVQEQCSRSNNASMQ